MKSVVYSLSFFTALVIALRVGAAFSALVALVIAAAVVWRWLAQPAQVTITRSLPARAFHGDRVTVEVTIENRGRAVHWLEIVDVVPQALRSRQHANRHVLSLHRDEAVSFTYELVCSRRGLYRVGPLEAVSGDLFGLRTVEFPPIEPQLLTVYPRIVPADTLGIPARAPVPVLRDRTALLRDPARMRGVRAYHAGDPRRAIHWPASARTGELQVKQLDPAMARSTMVVVNLIRLWYPRGRKSSGVEFAVTAAASLAHHIVTEQSLEVGLAVAGADPLAASAGASHPVGGGRSHLMLLLETLARVEGVSEAPFEEFVDAATTGLPWGASVAVITPWVTDELAATVGGLRRRGFAPYVLLVQPTAEALDAAASLRATGIGVLPIDDELNLVRG